MDREPGFYWIKYGDDIETAQWDGQYWWGIGGDVPMEEDQFSVISERIEPPKTE